MHGREGLENGLTGMSFDSHPISVFGQNRGGETHAERALHESSVGSALGIEGLPMTTRLCERSGNSLTELTVSEYDMTIPTICARHVFCDDALSQIDLGELGPLADVLLSDVEAEWTIGRLHVCLTHGARHLASF